MILSIIKYKFMMVDMLNECSAPWQNCETLASYLRWKCKQLGVTQAKMLDNIEGTGGYLRDALLSRGCGVPTESMLQNLIERIECLHQEKQGDCIDGNEVAFVRDLNAKTSKKYFPKTYEIKSEDLICAKKVTLSAPSPTPLIAPVRERKSGKPWPDSMVLDVTDKPKKEGRDWAEVVAETKKGRSLGQGV